MDLRTTLTIVIAVYLGLGISSWVAITRGSRLLAIVLWGIGGLILLALAAKFFYHRVLDDSSAP